MKTKRPLTEMADFAIALCEALKRACKRLAIAGSLRRQCLEVGDLELVAIPTITKREVPPPQAALFSADWEETEVIEVNELWDALDMLKVQYVKKGEKYRQFIHRDMQVDLFTATPKNWGWIHLIRTGSAEFSKHVAQQLNSRGYTSEDGRIRARAGCRSWVDTPEEEDVFRLAGMGYVDVKKRSL